MVKSSRPDYLMVCPLCNKKLWYTKIPNHRKKCHPEITAKGFESMIIEAVKSGKIETKYFEGSVRGLESGTQKIAKSKPKNKYGMGHIIQGGKVSPK